MSLEEKMGKGVRASSFHDRTNDHHEFVIVLESESPSPTDIVFLWHTGIVRFFGSNSSATAESRLLSIMDHYIQMIKKEAVHFKEVEILQRYMEQHLEYIHWLYSDSENCFSDIYLSYMEHLMTFYVNLKMRALLAAKWRAKIGMDRVNATSARIIKLLSSFLLNNEFHIQHVLIRQTALLGDGLVKEVIDILESNICKQLLKYLYRHFLIVVPLTDISDEAYCRAFILFENWKSIEPKKQRHNIDTPNILGRLFGVEHEKYVESSETLKKILRPKLSASELFLSVMGCDSSMTKTYFDHVKFRATVVDTNQGDFEGLSLEDDSNTDVEIDKFEERKCYCEKYLSNDDDSDVEIVSITKPHNRFKDQPRKNGERKTNCKTRLRSNASVDRRDNAMKNAEWVQNPFCATQMPEEITKVNQSSNRRSFIREICRRANHRPKLNSTSAKEPDDIRDDRTQSLDASNLSNSALNPVEIPPNENRTSNLASMVNQSLNRRSFIREICRRASGRQKLNTIPAIEPDGIRDDRTQSLDPSNLSNSALNLVEIPPNENRTSNLASKVKRSLNRRSFIREMCRRASGRQKLNRIAAKEPDDIRDERTRSLDASDLSNPKPNRVEIPSDHNGTSNLASKINNINIIDISDDTSTHSGKSLRPTQFSPNSGSILQSTNEPQTVIVRDPLLCDAESENIELPKVVTTISSLQKYTKELKALHPQQNNKVSCNYPMENPVEAELIAQRILDDRTTLVPRSVDNGVPIMVPLEDSVERNVKSIELSTSHEPGDVEGSNKPRFDDNTQKFFQATIKEVESISQEAKSDHFNGLKPINKSNNKVQILVNRVQCTGDVEKLENDAVTKDSSHKVITHSNLVKCSKEYRSPTDTVENNVDIEKLKICADSSEKSSENNDLTFSQGVDNGGFTKVPLEHSVPKKVKGIEFSVSNEADAVECNSERIFNITQRFSQKTLKEIEPTSQETESVHFNGQKLVSQNNNKFQISGDSIQCTGNKENLIKNDAIKENKESISSETDPVCFNDQKKITQSNIVEYSKEFQLSTDTVEHNVDVLKVKIDAHSSEKSSENDEVTVSRFANTGRIENTKNNSLVVSQQIDQNMDPSSSQKTKSVEITSDVDISRSVIDLLDELLQGMSDEKQVKELKQKLKNILEKKDGHKELVNEEIITSSVDNPNEEPVFFQSQSSEVWKDSEQKVLNSANVERTMNSANIERTINSAETTGMATLAEKIGDDASEKDQSKKFQEGVRRKKKGKCIFQFMNRFFIVNSNGRADFLFPNNIPGCILKSKKQRRNKALRRNRADVGTITKKWPSDYLRTKRHTGGTMNQITKSDIVKCSTKFQSTTDTVESNGDRVKVNIDSDSSEKSSENNDLTISQEDFVHRTVEGIELSTSHEAHSVGCSNNKPKICDITQDFPRKTIEEVEPISKDAESVHFNDQKLVSENNNKVRTSVDSVQCIGSVENDEVAVSRFDSTGRIENTENNSLVVSQQIDQNMDPPSSQKSTSAEMTSDVHISRNVFDLFNELLQSMSDKQLTELKQKITKPVTLNKLVNEDKTTSNANTPNEISALLQPQSSEVRKDSEQKVLNSAKIERNINSKDQSIKFQEGVRSVRKKKRINQGIMFNSNARAECLYSNKQQRIKASRSNGANVRRIMKKRPSDYRRTKWHTGGSMNSYRSSEPPDTGQKKDRQPANNRFRLKPTDKNTRKHNKIVMPTPPSSEDEKNAPHSPGTSSSESIQGDHPENPIVADNERQNSNSETSQEYAQLVQETVNDFGLHCDEMEQFLLGGTNETPSNATQKTEEEVKRILPGFEEEKTQIRKKTSRRRSCDAEMTPHMKKIGGMLKKNSETSGLKSVRFKTLHSTIAVPPLRAKNEQGDPLDPIKTKTLRDEIKQFWTGSHEDSDSKPIAAPPNKPLMFKVDLRESTKQFYGEETMEAANFPDFKKETVVRTNFRSKNEAEGTVILSSEDAQPASSIPISPCFSPSSNSSEFSDPINLIPYQDIERALQVVEPDDIAPSSGRDNVDNLPPDSNDILDRTLVDNISMETINLLSNNVDFHKMLFYLNSDIMIENVPVHAANSETITTLPMPVPPIFSFETDTLKNEMYNIDSDVGKTDNSDIEVELETHLPLKKRKLMQISTWSAAASDVSEVSDSAMASEISYPATPMLSIADVYIPPRSFKTPAEKKQLPAGSPSVTLGYDTPTDPPPFTCSTNTFTSATYRLNEFSYNVEMERPPYRPPLPVLFLPESFSHRTSDGGSP